MNLSEFILENMEPILGEWEKFAGTILPAARTMSQAELRNEARQILEAIAADMETSQTRKEQQDKSKGLRAGRGDGDSAATAHGAGRLAHAFDLNQLVSEYRALRASVIRLWTARMDKVDRAMLDELTRFNETIDEALTESIARYTQGIGRSRDLVMAALAHDLRTPLGAVVNSANFLLRTEHTNSNETKAASRILGSATRMAQMVSDLLDFTRTRLGQMLPIAAAPMNLADACRQAIEEIGAHHPEATFKFEPSGELAGVWDAGRIAQLLSNLMGNAVQHGLSGAPITITARGEDERVFLTVHNEGPPISEDVIVRIFEPLARAPSESVNSSSLGLGLYISREIACAHCGTIEASSSKTEGTTIKVCLPRSSLK